MKTEKYEEISKLDIEKVTKKFGTNVILENITLHCHKGKIYGIIGHNGSGKTVLLKCICGFYKVTEGKICVDGKKIGKDLDVLPNAGIIIEEAGFLKRYNALKNLRVLYTIRNKKNDEHLEQVLKMVGLSGSDRKKVGKYSLGMKQRLAIAQAIMENQQILILDEPMNGLDRKGMDEMRQLFLGLKKNKIILLASHNKDDINILCDEVYQLENSKMIRIK